MTHYILIFKGSQHSVDADGFGVCFDMGKKCYSRIRTLYIPSLCNYLASYDSRVIKQYCRVYINHSFVA